LETETLRLLADAVDAVRAAAQGTKNDKVDNLCGAAEHALKAAVEALLQSQPVTREPTAADMVRIMRAQRGIA
jgi:hypothetical protein